MIRAALPATDAELRRQPERTAPSRVPCPVCHQIVSLVSPLSFPTACIEVLNASGSVCVRCWNPDPADTAGAVQLDLGLLAVQCSMFAPATPAVP